MAERQFRSKNVIALVGVRTIDGDGIVIAGAVWLRVDTVPIAPDATGTHVDRPSLAEHPILHGYLDHAATRMNSDQIEGKVFADWERDSNVMLEKVCHDAGEPNIALVLRVMTHITPRRSATV